MVEKVQLIARRAGEVIRNGFGKNFSIEFKTNASNLVTEIDKKSEETIKNFIKKEFPGHAIIAEESGEDLTGSEYTWVVDPLDGTTNFAHGLPLFSVSIGVVKNNETVCGVVYDVMQDNMYTSEKGGGAFCNGKELKVSDNDKLEESLLVTGFPYDIAENPYKTLEKFNAFVLNSRAVRRLGSAAIDFCYVASGVFDGFWEVHLHPWDLCAGMLLVEEAGGVVTNFNNEKINTFAKQILATNGKVHEKMLEILQKNS
ncbi:MAG: inositol monophosphatase family protein [Ignavibacteria bacterium]|jgi:myo-inositol-1(or 4)-monophosphatase